MDMIIKSPEPETRLVTDYDIHLDSGFLLSVTIDHEKGDSFHAAPDVTEVVLAEKPSKFNVNDMLPAEHISIFTPHILVINKKIRHVTDISPEQRLNFLEAMKEAGGTIQ